MFAGIIRGPDSHCKGNAIELLAINSTPISIWSENSHPYAIDFN
ncbi:hypothetical protein Y11_24181 [Yersinia enterocolitica subsp. palearctica Y11]|uniref:Uncharacterized protein n=1 Tax=Yersinia enterocolitica subsp. palearctica serotype O:3 (strain DSM 13030 / CIP 106945 / Y11) TaxID=930944 RepID=A0A0H3NKY6_YERE1|nr:hypothetical protein Y11_24181 [Yersinia enterocolitica subsp. palearctica Y11]CCO70133.1 hypothetical protein D322_3276 [Yersinia enterocolitica IP 10393]